jgi:uncharacterized membrane protein YphA (DoxX/SURF4 family)
MKIIQNHKKILSLILVIFFSLTLILAGLDKFFNFYDNWVNYLNPKLLPFPIAPSSFMKLVGVFEILLGLSLFTRWRKIASYIVAIWFVLISLNLLTINLNFIAFKDTLRAVGAILLAKLSK